MMIYAEYDIYECDYNMWYVSAVFDMKYVNFGYVMQLKELELGYW